MAKINAAETEPFDSKQAEFIRIISEGGTLNDAAAAVKVHRLTLLRWLREDETGELRNQYTRAREDQGDYAADEITEIRRKVLSGEIPPDVGRVAIDSCKWEAGKRKAKVYGDKVQLGGDADNPVHVLTEVRRVIVRPDGQS